MLCFVLVAATTSTTSPAAPQPSQARDDSSPAATDRGGITPSSNFLVPMPGQLVLKLMFASLSHLFLALYCGVFLLLP